MHVKRYRSEDAYAWNEFLKQGTNQTFLFNRNFMDYHSDRFSDHSLMVIDDNKICALFPANDALDKSGKVISHEGLSYGGVIIKKHSKLQYHLQVIYSILTFLEKEGVNEVIWKKFPLFYNELQTEEIDYALFVLNAELTRRDVALLIDRNERIPYAGNLRREASKALKGGVVIKESTSFDAFWNKILSPNLQERYGVNPVHSLGEIQLLRERFPGNIRQFDVYMDDDIVGGTTLFIDNGVVHCQYISANDRGKKTGALNHLFITLIDEIFSECRFFDLGIVNEKQGREINNGLLFWKEALGGRSVRHDFYKISTQSRKDLEKFLK